MSSLAHTQFSTPTSVCTPPSIRGFVSTTGGGISTAFQAALAKVPPSTGGTGG
ncbi:hypothetical protein [Actinomyces johnsonii]|uniref:hypothetical protein n=1 Tax=Actinomyces johnsonii TaxID=544581 RepID=UPI0028D39E68|nr:hypothetical protein [Actinomyces johnsonii]